MQLIEELIEENPHKTPLTALAFVTDDKFQPKDLTTVELLKGYPAGMTGKDKGFSIGGGQHEFIARQRFHDKGGLPQVDTVSAEVYCPGVFKSLQKLVAQQKTHTWTPEQFEEKAMVEISGWGTLTEEQKEVAATITPELLVATLVKEHNEVPASSQDLSVWQVYAHLRIKCMEQKREKGCEEYITMSKDVRHHLEVWSGLQPSTLAVRCQPCFADQVVWDKLERLVSWWLLLLHFCD